MAQALVVDTAAAQSIRQEIGSRHLAAPEWPLKDDCHAQVMRRMIVAGEMLLHGEAQRQILEFDLAEPIMWQSENDPVEVARHSAIVVPKAQAIAPARRPPDREKAAFAHDLRLFEATHDSLDHFLNATLDRIEPHVTWVVHQYILQPVESAGQMRLGRRIAAHGGLDIAPRVLVWNFIEHFAKRSMRPWVLAVDRDMALIIIRARIERCAGLAKLVQRAKGRQAEASAEIVFTTQDLVAEHDCMSVHGDCFETEILHKRLQGIESDVGVVIELRDPSL